MSALKVNSTHGGRGPQPKTFDRWVASTSKRGAKRYRVHLGDGTSKLVAHKNAPDTARRIEAMAAARVEALDDENAELGEWTFAEGEHLEEEPEPGYLKNDDDGPEERLLKTFAHLLADAHRLSSRQLVEVVGIQAKHFAEERKNMLSLQLTSERLMAKRFRGTPRLRVAADGEEVEEGQEGGEEGDTFLHDLLGPLVQRYVAQQVSGASDGANGAPVVDPKGAKS